MINMKRLLAGFNGNPPADISSIATFEKTSGIQLPSDYAKFLLETNGGEGFVGEAYIILWRIEELVELNLAYQVSEFAPGLLLFGSDGGGEAFAYDLRRESKPIICTPFVGMELSLAREVASSFDLFVEWLASS